MWIDDNQEYGRTGVSTLAKDFKEEIQKHRPESWDQTEESKMLPVLIRPRFTLDTHLLYAEMNRDFYWPSHAWRSRIKYR